MNKSWGIGFAFLMALAAWTMPLPAQDDPGCKDHPMFTRLSGFYIDSCEMSDFDSYDFMDKDENEIVFEGQKTRIGYCLKEGGKSRSFLEIWRNYANALERIGGTVEFTNRYNAHLRLLKDGKEAWVHVADGGGDCYTLVIVEKKTMVQEITANEMLDALNSRGFIALDIHFDVDQAVIKTESLPIVGQIAALLKDNPQLAVSIEGHTDDTGSADRNKILSRRRAEAVVTALVEQGIEAERMSAVGWGQEKPVADNRSEEGKAKNRRVEIVKK